MRNNFWFFLSVLLLFSCKDPQPRKPVMRTGKMNMSESVAFNKKLYRYEEQLFKELIERDSLHTYINSQYGFWYAYIHQNSVATPYPVEGDEVRFLYEIKNIKGDLIYSKEELGITRYIVDQQDFMQGIQEGIKLMRIGEKVLFLLPSYKAYSYFGDKNKIGTNTPIIVSVELLSIN